MLAYHNDQALRDRIIDQVKAHREADEIAQGSYYSKNGKLRTCAVGCVLHDPDGGHIRYEDEFGIPVQLAHLEDGIFESLPLEQAKDWPLRFMDAIRTGADLTNVWPLFAIWLMVDEKWGVVNVTEDKEVQDICRRVAEGYQRRADGNPLSDADEEKIARDARAARVAWDSLAAEAARDAWAARVAEAAEAALAARVAWNSLAAEAARDAWAAFRSASADKLIELLQEAPVIAESGAPT